MCSPLSKALPSTNLQSLDNGLQHQHGMFISIDQRSDGCQAALVPRSVPLYEYYSSHAHVSDTMYHSKLLFLFFLSATIILFLLKSPHMSSLIKQLLPTSKLPLLSLLRTTPSNPFSSFPFNYPNQRLLSTTARKMVSSAEFLAPVETRRSIYPLSNSSPISDDRIVEIVRTAILHVPSSFNSQSTRAVVLLKKEHEKLWDITKECLKPQMPEEQFQQTSKKLDGFRAGYGTVC